MSEDLQKQLATLLARLMEVAGDATKWAGDQIPPLVQEKIALGRATETAWLTATVLLGSLPLTAWIVWKRARFEHIEDEIGTLAACIALSVVYTIVLSYRVQQIARVFVAPRLYVVEWLRGMVRGTE